jgi:hypothetical protein
MTFPAAFGEAAWDLGCGLPVVDAAADTCPRLGCARRQETIRACGRRAVWDAAKDRDALSALAAQATARDLDDGRGFSGPSWDFGFGHRCSAAQNKVLFDAT